jgi:hypothetical protein
VVAATCFEAEGVSYVRGVCGSHLKPNERLAGPLSSVVSASIGGLSFARFLPKAKRDSAARGS